MDHVDCMIMNALQKNGRISMNKLAESIPMSVPATCERVRKLEDNGAIAGYTVSLSPMLLGKTINAFILFACNIGEIDKVREFLNQDHRVISAHFLAGKYTMMLEVSCTDMNEYLDLIQILFPLGTSESYIQIECIKERFYDLLLEE
ncbi:MAG: Lrp/AsnC family transcriptional regulator [Eubacterium sp.]|nr:Lrp/AsnC family transcriptional regulator [Eubacterium sp.]